MQRSSIVKVVIDRPYEQVLAFLEDPLNFPRWGGNPGSRMQHLAGRDYLVDLPRGRLVMRFAEPNPFGVLDYSVFPPGAESGPVTPVRLYRNGDGAELILTWFQRTGASDEQFDSDLVWIESDLLRLKSLLEQR